MFGKTKERITAPVRRAGDIAMIALIVAVFALIMVVSRAH
jgi:hypothetical protein